MKLFWRRQRGPQLAPGWFVRLRARNVDPKTDQAWSQWMAASDENQQAFENQELAWELSAQLKDDPEIQALLQDIDAALGDRYHDPAATNARGRAVHEGVGGRWFSLTAVGRAPVGRAWAWGAAAALILLVGVAVFFFRDRVTVSEYTTATGAQRIVTLADNSTVSLNTGTQIRVLYSKAVRRVELLQGESAFSVTHESARPFEVRALHGVTTAVGTKFDVRIDRTTATVSVLEGTVTVSSSENTSTGVAIAVSAGQAVAYTQDGPLSAVGAAEAERIRGWQAQRIVFTNIALDDALREYNRYIKIPIVLEDPSLATRRINGVFRIGDEDAFLGALQRGLNVTISRTDSQIELRH